MLQSRTWWVASEGPEAELRPRPQPGAPHVGHRWDLRSVDAGLPSVQRHRGTPGRGKVRRGAGEIWGGGWPQP